MMSDARMPAHALFSRATSENVVNAATAMPMMISTNRPRRSHRSMGEPPESEQERDAPPGHAAWRE